MERFRGLDKAAEILLPYLQEFQEHFDSENTRYKELSRADPTNLGRVIKCHLISELYIDNYLREKLAIANIDDARLSYYQKVNLLPDRGLPPMFVKPGLLKLHQIRNKVAHNLNPNLIEKDLQPMTEIMGPMRRETEGLDSIGIIESFTTLACIFLIVTPPHLEDVVAKAVGQIDMNIEHDE